jgi:hypothetical protein
MYKLKLIKGRSYHGIVTATNKAPFVEVADEATAKKAVATGYFEIVSAPPPQSNTGSSKQFDVTKMAERQLDAYAAENGIDLAGLTKKADKLAKILEAAEAAAKKDDDSGGGRAGNNDTEGNKADFGDGNE